MHAKFRPQIPTNNCRPLEERPLVKVKQCGAWWRGVHFKVRFSVLKACISYRLSKELLRGDDEGVLSRGCWVVRVKERIHIHISIFIANPYM